MTKSDFRQLRSKLLYAGLAFSQKDDALKNNTSVVVSTVTGVHGEDNPVPYPELLKVLGGLAVNKRRYPYAKETELQDVDQPQRTDLEPRAPGQKVDYVEVLL